VEAAFLGRPSRWSVLAWGSPLTGIGLRPVSPRARVCGIMSAGRLRVRAEFIGKRWQGMARELYGVREARRSAKCRRRCMRG